ncbi:unnamed protein product, partial [Staurois parvus]
MYVKWFDTVMLLCDFSEFSECRFLSFSNFPPVPSPYVPTLQGMEPRRQMPASAGGHYRGHRGSAGQGKRRTDSGARCMVSPSVARGYRLCYTREYRQGGYT